MLLKDVQHIMRTLWQQICFFRQHIQVKICHQDHSIKFCLKHSFKFKYGKTTPEGVKMVNFTLPMTNDELSLKARVFNLKPVTKKVEICHYVRHPHCSKVLTNVFTI